MSFFQFLTQKVKTQQYLRQGGQNGVCVSVLIFSLVFLSSCQSENALTDNALIQEVSAMPLYAAELPRDLAKNTVQKNVSVVNTHQAKSTEWKFGSAVTKKVETVKNNHADDLFYHGLLAELYLQQGDSQSAAEQYVLASKISLNDTAVLKRATVLSASAGNNKQALGVANRWVSVATASLDAKQYQALLLLRTEQYAKAAEKINKIELFVTKESKKPAEGAQFVSQLLSLETHAEQAYKTYQVYLNKYGFTAQQTSQSNVIKLPKRKNSFDLNRHQQLTLARLAMKIKKYKVVSVVLDEISTEDASLMRAKAQNKLGHPDVAVTILEPWMTKKKTSDSARFEFVRFSILSGQKDKARKVLKKLVIKHPTNNDLLKSLIALDLDQKKWNAAEKYAKKLMRYTDYKSDAYHFLAEVAVARGQNKQALSYFLQVVDGGLFKSAQKKIPRLLNKTKGLDAAQLWIHNKHQFLKKQDKHDKHSNGSKTVTKLTGSLGLNSADLYKLEADLLYENRAYESALNYYQRALGLAPNDTEIRYRRALVYEQQGKIRLAEKDFKSVLAKNKHDPATLNALGYLLAVHTERLDEAMQYVKKAHQLSPEDAAINDSLGWLLYRKGEIKTAEFYLRKSFETMKQPDVASHLIEVLQKRGQQQEAKIILFQMLRLYPDDKKLKGISIN